LNFFLTRSCDQGCAFCYARDWLESEAPTGEDPLGALSHYAALVAQAGPPPLWSADQDEATQLLHAARAVNLLGGEPTEHPAFERVVRSVHELGLGPILFTSGAHPEPVRRVAPLLWSITINGHFAHRAPWLGVDPARIIAHLPLAPGDDVQALLQGVVAAGLRSAVLAFAAPAGGASGPLFTPDDLPAMRSVYQAAERFGTEHGLVLAWDCAFPRCVDPTVAPNSCSAVPVMDARGQVSICGGAYFLEEGRRPITSFDSLAALHEHCLAQAQRLRALPSRFARCTDCPERDRGCLGMCLAWRE